MIRHLRAEVQIVIEVIQTGDITVNVFKSKALLQDRFDSLFCVRLQYFTLSTQLLFLYQKTP